MKRKITIAVATLFAASALAAPAMAGGLNLGADAKAGIGANTGIGARTGVDANAGAGTGVGVNGGLGAGVQADASGSAQGTINSGVTIDPDVTASTAKADLGSVISSIGSSEANAGKIRTMTDVSSVNVVKVSEISGADAAAIDSAVSANQVGIDEIQASLQSNAAVNAALEAQSVDVSQVIAADVAATGELTVYVK